MIYFVLFVLSCMFFLIGNFFGILQERCVSVLDKIETIEILSDEEN